MKRILILGGGGGFFFYIPNLNGFNCFFLKNFIYIQGGVFFLGDFSEIEGGNVILIECKRMS